MSISAYVIVKLQAPAVVSTSASLKLQLLALAGACGLWLELNCYKPSTTHSANLVLTLE
jgi:hypothetical protein